MAAKIRGGEITEPNFCEISIREKITRRTSDFCSVRVSRFLNDVRQNRHCSESIFAEVTEHLLKKKLRQNDDKLIKIIINLIIFLWLPMQTSVQICL